MHKLLISGSLDSEPLAHPILSFIEDGKNVPFYKYFYARLLPLLVEHVAQFREKKTTHDTHWYNQIYLIYDWIR